MKEILNITAQIDSLSKNKLRDAVLSYETELKVHLDEYFKMILEREKIGFRENLQELYRYNHESKSYERIKSEDEIFKKFDTEWRSHITKFSHIGSDWNDYFYLLLKILTFGTINNILDLAVKQDNGKYRKLYELFHIHLKKKINLKLEIG